MSFPQSEAWLWVERIVGIAAALQTLELLQLKRVWSSTGIWRWKDLEKDYDRVSPWIRNGLRLLLGERGFSMLLHLRWVSALAMVLTPPTLGLHSGELAYLFLSTLLIGVRWRGSFNGGSDSMMLLVLGAAWVARVSGPNSRVAKGALAYVALQLCLSYFIAGVVKLKERDWRSGRALVAFASADYYDVPIRFQNLLRSRSLARVASWGVLAFECLFPLALLNSKLCLGFILGGVVFQGLNVYVFGLNRFLWTWGAAYPALYGWSVNWSGSG